MPVSSTGMAAVFAQETAEAFFKLLTIEHPTLTTPLRFVDREIGLVSNGATFIGAAFEIDLPDDTPDGLPTVQLSVDNVDREIIDTLRTLQAPFTARLDVVREADPDTIEASTPVMTALKADYDVLRVTADLGFEGLLNEPFPGDSFTPASHPGLF